MPFVLVIVAPESTVADVGVSRLVHESDIDTCTVHDGGCDLSPNTRRKDSVSPSVHKIVISFARAACTLTGIE